MEDVLEVYQTPYDPLRPVVCIDETNKQMIKEERIPCEPGNPEKVDSVYVRNGVANVFMIAEPLAGRRETVVTETRNAVDFAQVADCQQVLLPRRHDDLVDQLRAVQILQGPGQHGDAVQRHKQFILSHAAGCPGGGDNRAAIRVAGLLASVEQL